MLPKFNKNEEREKEKGGERKQRNFGNTVTEIPLHKMLPGQLKKSNCGNAIADNVKKNYFDNCGNPFTENEKKNYEICE